MLIAENPNNRFSEINTIKRISGSGNYPLRQPNVNNPKPQNQNINPAVYLYKKNTL